MTDTAMIDTKKPRKQGKLNEYSIIRDLTNTEGEQKKLYQIAIDAGSKATSRDNLAGSIISKIQSSSKIQEALERHRNSQLQTHRDLEKVLVSRINDKEDVKNIQGIQALELLIKNSSLIERYTKNEVGSKQTGNTNIQINIMQPKDDE